MSKKGSTDPKLGFENKTKKKNDRESKSQGLDFLNQQLHRGEKIYEEE